MNNLISDTLNREVKYLNKDFAGFRQDLINYAKNYFPNVYRDFNESSPGMMFIEMASYVGDVLSFYGDIQLQESFLYTVSERINLYNLAQGLGYKVYTVTPASVELDIYQIVPSIGSGTSAKPDLRYALSIQQGMNVSSQPLQGQSTTFTTIDPVDFSFSSSYDPLDVSVYSVQGNGEVEYFLLKKKVKAISGTEVTAEFEFTEPKPYDKITLPETNVSQIVSVVDSDGNTWYEVPFLAQDIIPESIRNTPFNDKQLSQYAGSVPYLLCWKQVERRFVTRTRADQRVELQFGAGLSSEADEEIVPNPFNVGIGLNYFRRAVDVSIDPMNFLYTRTYGTAPSNTTLTVKYLTANGLQDNVDSNTITIINSYSTNNSIYSGLDQTLLSTVAASLTINNPAPAFGAHDRKPLELVREEAMAHFAAQNRNVTREDYVMRCFTMPPKFGSVAKAYATQDTQLARWNEDFRAPNPYAINLYVLSSKNDGSFAVTNPALKENLKTYISQYRLMTDAVNIKDPYIVNIKVYYEIITRPGYNSNEVLLRCTARLKQLLNNDNMQINQPILISKLFTELDKVEGVQTVQNIKFENMYDMLQGYSGVLYDVEGAIRNGILYPSVDPMIFEVKFPNTDIVGQVNDL